MFHILRRVCPSLMIITIVKTTTPYRGGVVPMQGGMVQGMPEKTNPCKVVGS
jgi:hypothetical protein